jgi:flavin reductase (DIM6/NTAB) family NADH-FMN oxidoreductase RutF
VKQSLGPKTLAYPAPVWVIGTYAKDGLPNVMTASWAGICCSKPPCVYVALQKPRYTYRNVIERQAYTVNVATEPFVRQSDYFGMVSGKDTNKLTDCGLTAVKSDKVDAPYIDEFPLVLECRLVHTIELGLHTQFVGEIIDVKADPSILDANGLPDIEKLKPIVFGPQIRTYHGIGAFLGQAFSIGKTIQKTS